MKIKKTFMVIISVSLIFTGITQTANAAKPGVFSGQCLNSGSGAHQLTFSNIPGGTYYLSILPFGYLKDVGVVGTTDRVTVFKPYDVTFVDNDSVRNIYYIYTGGTSSLGLFTYKFFDVFAYSHNGSLKESTTRIGCP